MRGLRPATLRWTAAAALALATVLALRAGVPSRPVEVIAWDVSRSLQPDRGEADGRGDALAAALSSRAGFVLFGARARVVVAPGEGEAPVRRSTAEALTFADPSGTDLASALRCAAGLVPAGTPGRVRLFTDGRATAGDTGAALAELRAAGVSVVAAAPVPMPRLAARPAALRVPATARTGESLPIVVEITGPPDGEGFLTLEDPDGAEVHRRPFRIPAGGRARVPFSVTPGSPGVRTYRARVAGSELLPPAEGRCLVESGAPVLRLGRAPAGAGISSLLRAVSGDREADTGSGSPVVPDPPVLDGLALLVLDDVAEGDLGPDGGAHLRDAVAGGLGLVVLGGPNTLGAGGFAGRPVEECLPVLCAPGRPRPLLVLAMDASGSMEAPGPGGRSSAVVAREAAVALVGRAPADARLGIVRFSDRVGEVEGPFDLAGEAGRGAARVAASGGAPPGGGTRFGAAVDGALRLVATVPAASPRVLLLVTDGNPSEGADALTALGERLRAAEVQLRVFDLGGGPPDGLRPMTAAAGGERVDLSAGVDGGRLEAALLRAASGVDPAAWRPGSVGVRGGPWEGALGPRPAGLPPVEGHVRVSPREGAEVWLGLADGDPLLVAGRHGLGRSAVFSAPPAAGDGAWLRDPAAAVLAEALRWAMRPAGTTGYRGTAVAAAGGAGPEVALEVPSEVVPPAEVRVGGVALRRVGPRRFALTLPRTPASGIVTFEDGDGRPLARAPVTPAPDPEAQALGVDAAALARLRVEALAPPGAGRGWAGAGAGAAVLALVLFVAAALREAGDHRDRWIVQREEGRAP